MIKSCYGCRALRDGFYSTGIRYAVCSLGYGIREEAIRHADYKESRPIPTEKCPKPRTYRALNNLSPKVFS
jgi:hypothetical protein